MIRKSAYITIKDHKDNFNINPKYYLINPSKREPGKIAKYIADTINKSVRKTLYCNQ